MRQITRFFLVALPTYVVSCIFLGTIGACVLLFQYLRGKFIIFGYRRYIGSIAKGRLIIAASHSTVFNSMILLFLCLPYAYVYPARMFPYSFASADYFKSRLRFINKSILVKRGDDNSAGWRFAKKVLQEKYIIATAPEAARTDTPYKDFEIPPEPRWLKNEDGSRRLRNFIDSPHSKTTILALETDAQILPVYIDVPFSNKTSHIMDTMVEWIRNGETIVMSVGEPYRPDSNMSQADQNAELAKRILRA